MPITPPSKLATVGIFCLAYIGVSFSALPIGLIVESDYGTSFIDTNNSFAVFIVMMSAMLAAKFYFHKGKVAPSNGTAWLLAFYFALVSSVLTVITFVAVSSFFDVSGSPLQQIKNEFSRPNFFMNNLGIIIGVFLGLVALTTLATRLGFGLGVRSARKAYEKRQMSTIKKSF